MSDEPLVKDWQFDNARCVAWSDADGRMHGTAIRLGVPELTVVMPRGTDLDQLVEALEAAIDATSPRRQHIDGSTVTDVLLVMSHQEIEDRELQRPFQLSADLVLVPSHPDVERALLDACDPRGKNSFLSIDLRGPGLFLIARTLPSGTSSFGWDGDQRIQTVVALSRLIRPTPINLRFAARITGRLESGAYSIRPAEIRGHAAQAAVMAPQDAWLREDDLIALRELLGRWEKAPFDNSTPRWTRALWHLEYAMRTHHFHLRWPLVALAFEALITTNAFNASRQFRSRLQQIRDSLGLPPISEQDAKSIWRHRSDVVHGSEPPDYSSDASRLYGLLEETLRGAIRRAVSDLQYRAIFANVVSINAQFPVPKPAPKVVSCPACAHAIEIT